MGMDACMLCPRMCGVDRESGEKGYCGMDGKREFFRCSVKNSKKKFRSKIKAMKEWIKRNRMMPLEVIFDTVNAKLRGYYQ